MKQFISLFLVVILIITSILFSEAQNNALTLDGTDDYVNIGSSTSLKPTTALSAEAWVYLNDWTPSERKKIIANTEGGGWALSVSSTNTIELEIHNGTTYIKPSYDCTSFSGWHHIAGVFNGSSAMIYVDGDLKSTVSMGASVIYYGTTSNSTIIGAEAGSGSTATGNYLSGKLDEIRIWNDARTETEIRQNMYRELPDPSSETNLVAYYKFNETSGTTLNDSKGSYDGALTNMAGSEWQTSPAIFGPKNCLDFDGTDDYVVLDDADDLAELTSLTIEAWINTNSTKDWQEIVHRQDNNGNANSIAFGLYKGVDLYCYINSGSPGSGAVLIAGIVPLNKWVHVAMTWQASDGRNILYLNGVEVGANNKSTSALSVEGLGHTYIAILDPGREAFSGQIDDIRIWSDVRTASEIRENMCKTLTGNESGLVAYYNFDNTSGTTLQDFSGNENDGTLTNMDNADWVASSAFNTWLNTSASSWSTASNWSSESVPGSSDNVGIYDWGGTSTVTFSSSQTVNNMVISTGSALSVDPGIVLTVNGTLSNIAGITGLVLNSDATGTGMLVNNSTEVQATIEQYLVKDQWHYMGIPVTSVSDADSVFHGCYVIKSDESTATDEAQTGWTYVVDNEALTMGVGYGVQYNRTGSDNDTTIIFTGTLNTGNVTVNTTVNGQGWNFISNPYPCTIDWASIDDNLTNVNATIYLYDPVAGSYDTWNNGSSTGGQTQYIPPMQGFFVEGSGSAGSVSFTDSDKNSTAVVLKNEALSPEIKLAITYDDFYYDEMVVRVNAKSTMGFEGRYDAHKLKAETSKLPQLWSVLNGEEYAINTIPVITEDLVIPLKVLVKTSGEQKLNLKEIKSFNYSYPISLFNMQGEYVANLKTEDYVFYGEEGETVTLFLGFDSELVLSNNDLIENKILLTTKGSNIILKGLGNTPGKIMVYNISGQLIYNYETVSDQLTMPVNRGIYLVNIKQDNGILINRKAIVQY